MKCKKCKGEMQSYGFPRYNQRYECKCGFVFIPLMVRLFGKYQGYKKYSTKEEWNWI